MNITDEDLRALADYVNDEMYMTPSVQRLFEAMHAELLALRKVADAAEKMRDNGNALSFAMKAALKEAGR